MTFAQPRRRANAASRKDRTQASFWPLSSQIAQSLWTRFRAAPVPVRGAMMLGLCSASVFAAHAVGTKAGEGEPAAKMEEGIPVTSKLVVEKCGSCHAPDAKGNMSRISWVRTTPEGWAQAIKRMVKLNGLSITPEESREVVKYLATYHGLAPQEAKAVMYIPEHRIIDEPGVPNDAVRNSCAACHAFGQPLSWRRTKEEWNLLRNMHVALYSTAYMIYTHPAAEDGAQAQEASEQTGIPLKKLNRGDLGVAYMSKVAPLHTAEWDAWQSRIRDPQLAGNWLVSASVPGKGRYFGVMAIAPGTGKDEFKTSVTMHSLTDGSTLTRSGAAIVYGGYSWRGRSSGGAAADAAPGTLSSTAREAMWFSPDQKSAEGRWFWGAYDEFGFDVKLARAAGAPVIADVVPGAVVAGTKGASFTILGDALPTSLGAGDISLGSGVTVTKVVSSSPQQLVVTADVAADAPSGLRDVSVKGATLEKAFPVYHKVDYLKVTPQTAMARLGGIKYPKGYQQFEATGYDVGPDGKPNTDDDVAIGPVSATWSIEEFATVSYDDDKEFVGTIDAQTGLFTPNVAGPDPKRRFGRNNYGEVWVVATAKGLKTEDGKPMTGRAYLVTTVPQYQRFDQPEVAPEVSK